MKIKTIQAHSLHPTSRRAETIAKKFFNEVVLEDQEMLGTPERWKKILNLIPNKELQDTLNEMMQQCNNSTQRWSIIQSEVTKAINKVRERIVLDTRLVKIHTLPCPNTSKFYYPSIWYLFLRTPKG